MEPYEGVDGVFHVASYGMSGLEMLDAKRTHAVNVGGTRNVLRHARRAGVPALVYTSTYNVVYGGTPIHGGTEALPYFPVHAHVDEYSRTKALAEARAYGTASPFCDARAARERRRPPPPQMEVLKAPGSPTRTCAIRPAAIYGPGENRHFPRIAALMRAGLYVFRIGDPSVRVDWVHGDNLADAHVRAMAALLAPPPGAGAPRAAGQAFFVSDGEPVNQFTFLEPLARALGVWTQQARRQPRTARRRGG